MPTCICKNGHVTWWKNKRGARMPDTCRVCDQPNMPARWGGYDEAGNPRDGKQRTWIHGLPASRTANARSIAALDAAGGQE